MKTWEEMDRLGIILDAEQQLEIEEKRRMEKRKAEKQEKGGDD